MADRMDTRFLDTAVLLVRGTSGDGPLKANTATTRDVTYQMHVTHTRTHVKDLQADALSAP